MLDTKQTDKQSFLTFLEYFYWISGRSWLINQKIYLLKTEIIYTYGYLLKRLCGVQYFSKKKQYQLVGNWLDKIE